MNPSSTVAYGIPDTVVARAVGDEMVMLDLDSGVYYTLNGTGAFIWRCCEQGQPAEEIVPAITAQYEVSDGVARADLDAFFDSMSELGLIRVDR